MGQMLPHSFEFPKAEVKTMWDLWHFGNSAEKIRPYKKNAEFHDDLKTKPERERALQQSEENYGHAGKNNC